MPAALFLRLFLPYAAGNFAGSLYRSVNAVVAPDIIAEFLLSAEDMGLLTSVFFLLYAGVQIPLGIALDRFGARRVTAVLIMIAASGAALFSQASDFATLLIARAVMGLGISVAFMGALKAICAHLPRVAEEPGQPASVARRKGERKAHDRPDATASRSVAGA